MQVRQYNVNILPYKFAAYCIFRWDMLLFACVLCVSILSVLHFEFNVMHIK